MRVLRFIGYEAGKITRKTRRSTGFARKVKRKVKEAVESMTGFEVVAVDIHVQGIARRKAKEIEEQENF